MNGKKAKMLRRNCYPDGYTRDVYYSQDENGVISCVEERGQFRAYKKIYKALKKHGRYV